MRPNGSQSLLAPYASAPIRPRTLKPKKNLDPVVNIAALLEDEEEVPDGHVRDDSEVPEQGGGSDALVLLRRVAAAKGAERGETDEHHRADEHDHERSCDGHDHHRVGVVADCEVHV